MLCLSSYSHFSRFCKDENFLGLLMFFYFILLMVVPLFLFLWVNSVSQAVLYFVVTENNLEVGGIRWQSQAEGHEECLFPSRYWIWSYCKIYSNPCLDLWFMWKLSKFKSLFSSQRLKNSRNVFFGVLFFFLLFSINQMVYWTHRRKPSS